MVLFHFSAGAMALHTTTATALLMFSCLVMPSAALGSFLTILFCQSSRPVATTTIFACEAAWLLVLSSTSFLGRFSLSFTGVFSFFLDPLLVLDSAVANGSACSSSSFGAFPAIFDLRSTDVFDTLVLVGLPSILSVMTSVSSSLNSSSSLTSSSFTSFLTSSFFAAAFSLTHISQNQSSSTGQPFTSGGDAHLKWHTLVHESQQISCPGPLQT
mmetsp:Transcript_27425/g.68825  ORF Transcript_27425/g.68825 Transcript_27425/m.68825 type:complete len:214 (-) Transcript_27425:86-727(-)